MDPTPQRGAFSRVLNRLARNTKIVFSPQRGGFSWALCLHDYFRDSIFCVTGAALENPVQATRWLSWYGVGLASADRLPVVVRIPAGPLGSLKCDPPKGNGR